MLPCWISKERSKSIGSLLAFSMFTRGSCSFKRYAVSFSTKDSSDTGFRLRFNCKIQCVYIELIFFLVFDSFIICLNGGFNGEICLHIFHSYWWKIAFCMERLSCLASVAVDLCENYSLAYNHFHLNVNSNRINFLLSDTFIWKFAQEIKRFAEKCFD